MGLNNYYRKYLKVVCVHSSRIIIKWTVVVERISREEMSREG